MVLEGGGCPQLCHNFRLRAVIAPKIYINTKEKNQEQ